MWLTMGACKRASSVVPPAALDYASRTIVAPNAPAAGGGASAGPFCAVHVEWRCNFRYLRAMLKTADRLAHGTSLLVGVAACAVDPTGLTAIGAGFRGICRHATFPDRRNPPGRPNAVEALSERVQIKITKAEVATVREKTGMVPTAKYLRNYLKEQKVI